MLEITWEIDVDVLKSFGLGALIILGLPLILLAAPFVMLYHLGDGIRHPDGQNKGGRL